MSKYTSRHFARPAALPMALLALAVAAACGGGPEVARLDVVPAIDLADSVPLGEPLNLRYSWTPGAGFEAPSEDYQVFMHMVDPQGNIVLQDDHYPSEPTSQWRAGGTVAYSHWMYPPEVEYLDIVLGLYSMDGRAEIRSGEEWAEAVTIHRLNIRADDMSGIPVFMDGWHPQEEVTEPVPLKWRWTNAEAHAVFTNPRKDAVLHLRAHGPFDEVGAQTIILLLGETEVARVEVTAADEFMERIDLPVAAMGDNDWIELTMRVEPPLRLQDLDPTSQDDRTLGIQVFHLYMSAS